MTTQWGKGWKQGYEDGYNAAKAESLKSRLIAFLKKLIGYNNK